MKKEKILLLALKVIFLGEESGWVIDQVWPFSRCFPTGSGSHAKTIWGR
jgi:hypothetical protein